jgi:hypothetical protein
MIKKYFICVLVSLFFISLISAGATTNCDLNASLVNQDPYPVVPGEYIEVVFQLSGLQNSNCDGAIFELISNYPFSLDKGEESIKNLQGSTYVSDYKKTWMIPYKLRVDNDAMDGFNQIEVRFSQGDSFKDFSISKKFDIKIEDVRVDFEVHVKEYSKTNNEITFEILNTGKHDVEALTIEILEQENFILHQSPKKIVGSLDSNEETEFTYTAEAYKGNIDLQITYTDEINERRTLNKGIEFNPKYFEKNQENGKEISWWIYLIAAVIVIWVIIKIIKKHKHKKNKK